MIYSKTQSYNAEHITTNFPQQHEIETICESAQLNPKLQENRDLTGSSVIQAIISYMQYNNPFQIPYYVVISLPQQK